MSYEDPKKLRRSREQASQPAQAASEPAIAPGKRTQTMRLPAQPAGASSPVQRKPDPMADPARRERVALTNRWIDTATRPDLFPPPIQRKGTGGMAEDASPVTAASSGQAMPEEVQAQMEHAFGADFSAVRIHQGPQATSMGALAYTQGTDIHFAPGQYDLASQHGQALLGHELAHVVQQSQGRVRETTQAKGVGVNDDAGLEREADEMGARAAQREQNRSAGELGSDTGIEQAARIVGTPASVSRTASGPIQRTEDEAQGDAEETDTPVGGINQPGFVDHDDGSNIRSRPAEMAGSQTLTSAPLPPTTRVFVSGHHPATAEWLYVSAFLPDAIVNGYVQHFRVTTDLPEPTAKLYQIQSGDTAELLARREFSSSVQDGRDLRFYENVLLYVNRERGRTGITGSYQAPNIFGGGSNNIQLIADRRIWLVSPAYALALGNIVPDGSLTNGAVAGARRVLGHLEDILASVTDSPQYFTEVAGEYAQAIQEHLPEIIAITAGFILAESASAFLAATPTGVGQLAALLIQLAIAAFGAHFAVEAAGMALEYAQQWLTIAWTCNGDLGLRAEASRYFLRMLVQIAMAALAIAGVRGSMNNALRIADAIHITPPALGWSPGMVTPDGARIGGGPVFIPGSIASSGPVAIGGNAMMSVPAASSGIVSLSARANGLEHRAESARRAAEALPDNVPEKWDLVREARELQQEATALRALASESTEAASALRAEIEAIEARLTALERRIQTAASPMPPAADVPRPHLGHPANQLPTAGDHPYEPPARAGSPELVRAPEGGGFLDRHGNRWEWAHDQHGGPHWDVQHPNGSHTNVFPDGMVHQGRDNFGR